MDACKIAKGGDKMLENIVKKVVPLIGALALSFSTPVFGGESHPREENYADNVVAYNQGVENAHEALGEGDGYSATLKVEKWKNEKRSGTRLVWVPRRGHRHGHWKEVPYKYTELVHYPAGEIVLQMEDIILDEEGKDLHVNAHGRYEVWVKGKDSINGNLLILLLDHTTLMFQKDTYRVKIINNGSAPVRVDAVKEI